MNIMPWGTLGLATVVGAQIGDQSLPRLGFATSLISFGVFPFFGMLSGWLSAQRPERARALRDGFIIGSILSLSLSILNWFGIIELAGVLGGLSSALVCLLLFRTSNHSMMPPWHAVRPYLIVLGLIAVIRVLPILGLPMNTWTMEAGGVRFAPLTSPGIALLGAILILSRIQTTPPLLLHTLKRAMKPLLALGGFTLMAQMMVISGMVRTLGEALPVSSLMQLGPLSSLFGALSGYITGSNVGGNALMMSMQMSLTDDPALQLALSAIQNSSAGHAVFASMPIILLVLAIAGPGEKSEEFELVRFGLKVLLLTLLVLISTSVIAVYFSNAWT